MVKKGGGPMPVCDQPGNGPDAVVRFGATRDRMKLGLSCYTPAREGGRPLDAARLTELAREAGLGACLDPEAVARAVDLLLSGQDARAVVLARGKPPQPPRDAWVELLGDSDFPVFFGQAFARLHPPEPALPGRDITGAEVPPPKDSPQPREWTPPPDAGCEPGEDGLLRATRCGLVRLDEAGLRLEPLFQASKDRLTLTGTVHSRDFLGQAVTAARIQEELSRLGVAVGFSLEAAEAAVAAARGSGAPVPDVVLAQGRAPEPGRDGWLEFFQIQREKVGTMDDTGRVDWRDRGFSPVVEQGGDIARHHPPTEGSPGQDVFGETVPAKPGRPLALRLGRGVEALEAGLLLRAKVTGAVLWLKGVLDVSELLDVPGDVDYSTGNIRVLQGSVHIKGNVRSGFEVEAPGAVLVDQAVENARITSGADVTVRGGVFMSGAEGAFIKAEGSVSAAYSHNARISAGGDVTIAHYITCSVVQSGYRVRSGGRVKVTDPKGRIMGGTVVCAEGLEVYEAGSPLGVATVLALSPESPELRALILEKRQIKMLLAEVDKSLGQGPPEDILSRLPAEQRAEALVRLGERDAARKRLPNVLRALAEVAQAALASIRDAGIRVSGVAHPGVVIKMGGRSLTVERPLERVRFLWSEERREIYMAGL
jgi:hypothetical protein